MLSCAVERQTMRFPPGWGKQEPNALILTLAWVVLLLALGFGLLSLSDGVSKILGLVLVVLGVSAILFARHLYKHRRAPKSNTKAQKSDVP